MSTNADQQLKDGRRPIPLAMNKEYVTYKLYAEMANSDISPEDGMKIAVLTVTDWLKAKLGDNTPKELRAIPPVDKYKDGNIEIPSFYHSRGYTINFLYLEEKQAWCLQLSEPDLGLSDINPKTGEKIYRKLPTPGRIFTTNVGFCVHGKKLECGIKINVIEPNGDEAEAEVFRPAIVRRLMQNKLFGFKNIEKLAFDTADKITTLGELDKFISIIHDRNNYMPGIVIVDNSRDITRKKQIKSKEKTINCIEDFVNVSNEVPLRLYTRIIGFNALSEFDYDKYKCEFNAYTQKGIEIHHVKINKVAGTQILNSEEAQYKFKLIRDYYDEVDKQSLEYEENKNATQPAIEVADFIAKKVFGAARVCFVSEEVIDKWNVRNHTSIESGSVLTIDAKPDSELLKEWDISNEIINRKEADELNDETFTAIRQHTDISYGNVLFMDKMRDLAIDSLNDGRKKLKAKKNQGTIQTHQHVGGNRKVEELEEKLQIAKEIIDDQNKQLLEKEKKLRDINLKYPGYFLDYISRRATFPSNFDKVTEWVNKYYEDQLIVLPQAEKMMSDYENRLDIDLLCNAIDYLATDFYDNKFNQLNKGDMLTRMSKKYHYYFEIVPCGELNIKGFPQYSVNYGGKNVLLKWHLKIGNKTQDLLRIYFFVDSDKRKIVIGSWPEHLPTQTNS